MEVEESQMERVQHQWEFDDRDLLIETLTERVNFLLNRQNLQLNVFSNDMAINMHYDYSPSPQNNNYYRKRKSAIKKSLTMKTGKNLSPLKSSKGLN